MTIQQHASFDSSAAELNATSKLVKAWESKNAKNAAKAGGVSLMALSLAACGGSSTTTTTTDSSTDTSTTDTTTTTVDAAQTLKLTLRDDTGSDFTGGSGDDLFDGFTTSSSLTNGDVLDGGDGTDTLAAYGITGTVAPTTTSVEIFEVRGSGGSTSLTLSGMDGLTSVVNEQSTGNVAFTTVAAGVDFEVIGTGSSNTTLTMTDATGSADAINVAVTGANGDFVADGIETVNITAGKPHGASTTASVDKIDSNTLKTLNVTSDTALDLGVVTQGTGASKAITVDASAANGVTLDLSDFNGTSAGAASVGNTVTLSDGDDSLELDIADISKYDTYAGGAGKDTLVISDEYSDAGSSKAAYANVSGFEYLELSAGTEGKGAATTQLSLTDAEGLTWVEKVIMSADVDHDLLDVPDDFIFEVAKSATVNQVVTVSWEAGITDATLNLMGGSTLADADITNSGVLNISSGGSAANKVTAIVGSTAPKFVITGSQDLDLNDGVLAATTLEVDASAMTGNLLIETSAKATKVTGGDGDDTITGGAKADTIIGGAGNDTIKGDEEADVVNAGAGNDTITAMIHATLADTITTGTGTDTVILEDHSSTLAVAFKEVTITDFDFGTASTTVDTLNIANSMIEAADFGGSITGSFHDSSANEVSAGDGTVVHLTTDGQTVNNADVVVLSQTYATAAAALAGMQTAGLDTFNFGSALADADIMLVAYSDGTDSHLAAVVADLAASVTNGNTTSDIFDAIDVLATFEGVSSLSALDSGDVSIIA